MNKTVPFSKKDIKRIAQKYSTPFHIYDEESLRLNARRLYKVFSWAPGFMNYFAVKACPNPYIMKILREEGMGADCSSLPELVLAQKVGLTGEQIMFSSNDTPWQEFKKAKSLGAIINFDDITHIPYFEKHVGKLPSRVSLRYNPGPQRAGNVIIGDPKEAKFGVTKKQLFEAYALLKRKGVKRFGLHTMVVSNELNSGSFVKTAGMLFDLVIEISKKLDITFDFINLGGGIGIPYRPKDKPVDIELISKRMKKLYEEKIMKNNLHPLKIFMEQGRMVIGPYGYLVTQAIHRKNIYKKYIGVDACMTNLMRPGMYKVYHHITVLGKEKNKTTNTYDVVGSLCENNDKFAIDRRLPKIETGDYLVIHDAGAHGHAMGFNYNGKLKSAELLLKKNGKVQLIRRAETIEDYFATLNFSRL